MPVGLKKALNKASSIFVKQKQKNKQKSFEMSAPNRLKMYNVLYIFKGQDLPHQIDQCYQCMKYLKGNCNLLGMQ